MQHLYFVDIKFFAYNDVARHPTMEDQSLHVTYLELKFKH